MAESGTSMVDFRLMYQLDGGEVGEERFDVSDKTPILQPIETFAAGRFIPLHTLQITHNGKVIPPQCRETAAQLGVSNGDTIHAAILVGGRGTHKVKKRLFEPWDRVFGRFPSEDGGGVTWRRMVIFRHEEGEDVGGYGPCRSYTTKYAEDELTYKTMTNIPDYDVIQRRECLPARDADESNWIGVERRFDSDSADPWAREAGWYVVKMHGREEPFVSLSDALRAHDALTAVRKGSRTEPKDLNIPGEWESFFGMLEGPFKASEQDIKAWGRALMWCLLANDRCSSVEMKLIGPMLLSELVPEGSWSSRGHQHGHYFRGVERYYEAHIWRCWKLALEKAKENYKPTTIEQVLEFSLFRQCLLGRMTVAQISYRFVAAQGSLEKFASELPIFRRGCEAAAACSGTNCEAARAYLEENEPNAPSEHIYIKLVDAEGYGINCMMHVGRPMKEVRELKSMARSLRFIEVHGRRLFLSSLGKLTPNDLGVKDGDAIKLITIKDTTIASPAQPPPDEPKPRAAKAKKGKNRAKAKSKRKKPVHPLPPVRREEELRKLWMDAISRVFAEADPRFREIRQRLNAMNLERTTPKRKKKRPAKPPPAVKPSGCLVDGAGGKAGRSHFIVRVGEVGNLYKTTKPSATRGRPPDAHRREDITVDLHGLTREEALGRLDGCLPGWIDAAMRGSYPFVVPVKIVCGGGSQVLAEAVEDWIGRNDSVSNAPKNLYA